MDLLKLSRNTIYNTVPFYKLKVGTPVYLFQTNDGKHYELDESASLISNMNPKTGEVLIVYANEKKGKYTYKNCAVIGEMKK